MTAMQMHYNEPGGTRGKRWKRRARVPHLWLFGLSAPRFRSAGQEIELLDFQRVTISPSLPPSHVSIIPLEDWDPASTAQLYLLPNTTITLRGSLAEWGCWGNAEPGRRDDFLFSTLP